MERLFTPTILENFLKDLQDGQKEMNYIGDLSDFGNEIGVSLGHVYPNFTPEEVEEFIIGLRHGISATNNNQ